MIPSIKKKREKKDAQEKKELGHEYVEKCFEKCFLK